MTVSSDSLTQAHLEHPRDDPTLERIEAPLASIYLVLGFRLRVETNEPRVQQAADESFGPRLAPDTAPELTVRLLTHHVAEEPGWRPLQPVVRHQRGLAYLAASRATTVACDTRGGLAIGFVSATVTQHAEFLRACIVQSTAFSLIQPRCVAAVHSACVVKDGRAVILRGASGAGKTTLTYAALRHGYALLAEDVIFIRSARDPTPRPLIPADIRLHGLPWTLNLLPDAALLFPELAGKPTFERISGEHKLAVDITARFPGQTQAEAPLGPLVFIARTGARHPCLETLDRAAALQLLHDTAIMHERDIARDTGLWEAFLSYPAYWLATGDDPHENAAQLDAVLAGTSPPAHLPK